jgi:hypothetical protein
MPDIVDPSSTQIVSNARGPYPQVEMFSVPSPARGYRRGGSIRRNGNVRFMKDNSEEAMERIIKRLADVSAFGSTALMYH